MPGQTAAAVTDDSPHLLVVDDDRRIRQLLSRFLMAEGYRVTTAESAAEARASLKGLSFDLLILDVMMPGETGFELARALRTESNVPILMLTARDEAESRIEGLEIGADDYVAKPFHLEEVLARIRALLRRSTGHAKSELTCGSVRLDTRTGRVSVDGNPVKLTSHEYRLLAYLMHHSGRVVSRTELVEHLYDQDFDRDSNTIEVFVGRIRKKLDVDVIQTVRGLGYLLTPPDAH